MITYTGTPTLGQYENEATATYSTREETYTNSDMSHYFGTDLEISPQLLEAEITQEGDLDAWNSGTIYKIKFKPTSGTSSYSFELTFAYPEGYDVKVDYTFDLSEASPSSLTNDPLVLNSVNHGGSINKYIPRDGNAPLKLREEGDFVDEFTQKYDLYVDPQKLVEDYAAEDVLTFHIHFTLSETAT